MTTSVIFAYLVPRSRSLIERGVLGVMGLIVRGSHRAAPGDEAGSAQQIRTDIVFISFLVFISIQCT